MATSQNLPRPRPRKASPAKHLAMILSGPLPELPDAKVAEVASELRRMRSERAAAVWRHPGWIELVGWVIRQVPASDPTLAAVHAVRNANRTAVDPDYARCLASYLRQVARSRSTELAPSEAEDLTWDPPEDASSGPRTTDSLAAEAARLLEAVGIPLTVSAWDLIAPSIDIAVDWWEALATRTGMVGADLIAAARDSERITNEDRLRANFDGPAARPLVALLVGGDQQGRWARERCGREAGLLYWALLARNARRAGGLPPEPPEPVRRAWARLVAWIERAIDPTEMYWLDKSPELVSTTSKRSLNSFTVVAEMPVSPSPVRFEVPLG